jgi:hypothetical protein
VLSVQRETPPNRDFLQMSPPSAHQSSFMAHQESVSQDNSKMTNQVFASKIIEPVLPVNETKMSDNEAF